MEIFDEESITKTGEFLTRCIDLVKPPCLFWACYQSNAFADKLHASSKDVQTGLNKLRQMLINRNVHLGNFSINMRNTKEIVMTNIAQKSTNFEGKKSDVSGSIRAKPSTLVGAIPTLVRVHWAFLLRFTF